MMWCKDCREWVQTDERDRCRQCGSTDLLYDEPVNQDEERRRREREREEEERRREKNRLREQIDRQGLLEHNKRLDEVSEEEFVKNPLEDRASFWKKPQENEDENKDASSNEGSSSSNMGSSWGNSSSWSNSSGARNDSSGGSSQRKSFWK